MAMLSWLAVHLEHARIENDLSARSAAALAKAGMPWAAPGFAGRDGVIAGRATAETDPARAIAIVRDVWGVRIADNRVELLDFVDKFVWNAEVREKRLKLTGVVPGEDARRAVLGAAKSAFPAFAITDELRLARGPVDAKSWSTGAIFALTQLSGLRKGYAELNGLALSIGGEASTRPSYDAVTKALAGPLAGGLKLARQEITAPIVSPYAWSALWEDDKVSVGGYSPDQKTADAIKTAVDRRFGAAEREVALEIGSGAPDGFGPAVLTAIEQLQALKSGSAELVGSKLTFKGEAADARAAADVRAKLKAGVPRTITLVDDITFPEPVAPPPPPVPNPYVLSGGVDGSTFVLEGYVPDEVTRRAVADAVRSRFPRFTVDDRLKVAAGAPTGWQACVTAGIDGVAKLDGGELRLEGTTLRIAGSTTDRSLADTLQRDVQAAAGTGCTVAADIDFIAPEPPPAPPPPIAVPAPDPEAERRKAEAERCETLLREAAARGVILFEYASADLDPKSTGTLNELARIANTCPTFRIEIEGHTDSDGTPERHQKLSDRRAAAVVNVLIKSGVAASRLTAVGYGATRPVADNATPEGRAMNRRIEFSVKPN